MRSPEDLFRQAFFLLAGIAVGMLLPLYVRQWNPRLYQWIDKNKRKLLAAVFVLWLIEQIIKAILAQLG